MKVCKVIKGLVILVAGVELFANVSLAGLAGSQIAGLLFALFGVVVLVHAMGMCGACTSCCVEPEQKKK